MIAMKHCEIGLCHIFCINEVFLFIPRKLSVVYVGWSYTFDHRSIQYVHQNNFTYPKPDSRRNLTVFLYVIRHHPVGQHRQQYVLEAENVRGLHGVCWCLQFGESQKLRLVRILRSTVMVRVGGGWVALDEFLVKNDPCRGRFVNITRCFVTRSSVLVQWDVTCSTELISLLYMCWTICRSCVFKLHERCSSLCNYLLW